MDAGLSPVPAPVAPPDRPTLLVVDDEPSNIDTLVAVLEADHELAVATSGAQALAYLAQGHRPDLILLDVMMPDLDGYAVCAALQAQPAWRDIPVIFVTAKSDVDSEAQALAGGAVDFIHKPYSMVVVRARVKLHLTLAARERQLAALAHELELRVAERTRALMDALVQARQAGVAKANFMGNMSHELRTPLASIRGFAELLAVRLAGTELATDVAIIVASAHELEAIVTDILNYTAVQNGQLLLDEADFDLRGLALRLGETFEQRARKKNLAFDLVVDAALPARLRGDEDKLERVVASLANNAIKFTSAGRVSVSLCRDEPAPGRPLLRIEVSDTGIGMSQQTLDGLFEPFEQADMSSTRAYGGLGLGLALTQRLVQLMGGRLEVTSRVGQGSSVRVMLPLQAAEVDAGVQGWPAPGGEPAGPQAPKAVPAGASTSGSSSTNTAPPPG